MTRPGDRYSVFSRKCRSTARLDGKTAVITGSNRGIGKITVQDFARRGCRVVMACRDVKMAGEALREIQMELLGVKGVGSIVIVKLDLSSLESVRQCAADILRSEPAIHLLVNNAGIAACPRSLSADGYELQFAVNHLGHFLFTLLLLPRILSSKSARIINVASVLYMGGHIDFDDINMERGYGSLRGYMRSKLANVLFARELAKRLEERKLSDVTTYSLHPGVINTAIYRHLDKSFCPGLTWAVNHLLSLVIKTPVQGAQTQLYCALDESLASQSGLYYCECRERRTTSKARDPVLANRLWEESIKMVGLENYDPFGQQN